MLVSINWIKDYVDLDGCDIKGLINKFTLATAEVEDIYYMGRDVQKVVVGEIKTLENHPESKKLHLRMRRAERQSRSEGRFCHRRRQSCRGRNRQGNSRGI